MTRFLSSVPALEAADVPAELTFWQGLLGWTVTTSMGEPPTFARLTGGDAHVTISVPMTEGAAPSVSTLAAVYVEVDDVDGLYERLAAARVDIGEEPTTRPWGLRDFVARTPTGHLIAFGQRLA
jgi:catechol 2,3-dioxygenase-like lactoylglutathione lyase family enzyme